jgi:predicted unusual protein kinase regulating ubiquinone biosynthesis (AarF/ABC1/UbiB family)
MASSTDVSLLREALRRAGELLQATTAARLALQGVKQRIDLDALPPEIRDQVAEGLARVAAPEPLPWREVEAVLREAWGTKPDRVLARIDRKPVAVRPASQVHRGVADDGQPVAVKVLRPGITTALRSELGLADAAAAVVGAALPAVDMPALAREARERLLDELDLEYEGGVQRSFARALRRHGELGVPGVHSALTHETVLVSDWVDGTTVADLLGEQRDRAAGLLARFHLGAAVFGTVHADPDPRDALLDGAGRLWILDFGATRAVQRDRVVLAADAFDALTDAAGADRFAEAVAGIGWLPWAEARRAHSLAREILGPMVAGDQTVRLDAATLAAIAQRAQTRRGELLALALRGRPAPQDLWPLRMLAGLGATLAQIEAGGEWAALTRTALREGWG